MKFFILFLKMLKVHKNSFSLPELEVLNGIKLITNNENDKFLNLRIMSCYETNIGELKDKCLEFIVLKTKDVNNGKMYNFHFLKYNYYMLLKHELKFFYCNESEYLHPIFRRFGSIKKLENFREIGINNSNRIFGYDTIITDNIQDLNFKHNDIYLLKTLLHYTNNTSIVQKFKYAWFFVDNKIQPAASYNVNMKYAYNMDESFFKKFKINDYTYDNNYFILDENINSFFVEKLNIEMSDINIMSFDLECDNLKNSSFPVPGINSITHMGIDLIQTKMKKSFCLISIDIFKNIKEEVKKIISNNQDLAKLYTFDQVRKNYKSIIADKYVWKLMEERSLLFIGKKLIEGLNIDFNLTYNGTGFDYPFFNGRLLVHSMEPLKLITFFKKINFEVKNKILNYSGKNDSYQIIVNRSAGIYYDIYNYVKVNYNTIDSFSLNYFSQLKFQNTFILERVGRRIKVSALENINYKTFYLLLRTSNYCFIDKIPFVIIDKSNIINSYDKIHDDESIESGYMKDFYIIPFDSSKELDMDFSKPKKVSLSKDAIEIFDKEAFVDYDSEKCINYAKYCLNDTILCRFIFFEENLYFRVTASSNNYFLYQNISFIYKSSTNCLGNILETLLESKQYIIKRPSIGMDKCEGGAVIEPKYKINNKPVLCFDFQSLYPNIFIFHNISPETIFLIYTCKSKLELLIVQEKLKIYKAPDFKQVTIEKVNSFIIVIIDMRIKGFIPLLLEKGLRKRLEYKQEMKKYKNDKNLYDLNDNMQYITKIYINSLYGLENSEFFIFPCNFCAQLCTILAKEKLLFIYNLVDNSYIKSNKWYPNMIKHILHDSVIEKSYNLEFTDDELETVKELESKRIQLEVVYGDTDSNMISIDVDNIKIASIYGFKLFKILNKHILKNTILFEFENIYSNLILLTKKRYNCTSIEPKDAINIRSELDLIKYSKDVSKGISIVRRDCSMMQKTFIKKCIVEIRKMIKNKIEDMDDSLLKIVNNLILEILNSYTNKTYDINDYLLTMKYNKNQISESHHIHEKIKQYNENKSNQTKIGIGDRFSYTFVTNKPLTNLPFFKSTLNNIENEQFYIINTDTYYIKDGYRISIEVFMRRAIKDISSYFITNKNLEKTYFI